MSTTLKIIITSVFLVVAGAVCLECELYSVGPAVLILGALGLIAGPPLADIIDKDKK